MINVKCIIHASDKYAKKKWPTEMAARPLEGDSVESENSGCILYVLSITHAALIVPDKESCQDGRKEVPGLKVHLGL